MGWGKGQRQCRTPDSGAGQWQQDISKDTVAAVQKMRQSTAGQEMEERSRGPFGDGPVNHGWGSGFYSQCDEQLLKEFEQRSNN